MKTLIYGVIGLVVLIAVFRTTGSTTTAAREPTASAPAACSVAKITVKSMKAGWVDRCNTRSCPQMTGVAELHNGCAESVGVHLKMVARDASGSPVASRDFWPNSVSNIPPGDFTFSLDHVFQHDAAMKTFTLTPIEVKRWR